MKRFVLPTLLLALPGAAGAVELPLLAPAGLGTLANADDVAYGDFDGDGDLDVVAASAGADRVSWFTNVDGTAANATEVSVTLDAALQVAVADMDNDGDLDTVVVAAGSSDVVRVYWNAAGVFTAGNQATVASLGNPAGLALGDIDQDGDVDIAMSRSNGNLYWYANGRDQTTWTETIIDATPSTASRIDLGDLDGDSDLDLVVAVPDNGSGAEQIVWWENRVDVGQSWGSVVIGTQDNPDDVSVGDIDGDGDMDVVAVMDAGSGSDVMAFENTGAGAAWSASTIAATLSQAEHVTLFDLDTDGDLDVLTASSVGSAVWYESSGGATSWTSRSVAGTTGDGGVAAADFDGDGDPDLLVSGNAGVGVVENVRLHPELTFSVGSTTAGVTAVFESGGGEAVDMDNDGDLDFTYAGGGNPNNVRWLENDLGNGTSWTDHLVFNGATGNNLGVSRAFDYDFDGDQDLFATGAQSDLEILMTNVSTPGNNNLWNTNTAIGNGGDSPRSHYLVDLDHDGDKDALIGAYNHDDLLYLVNNRTASGWGRVVVDANLDQVGGVHGADINGDGATDIVAHGNGTAQVVRWYSNTNGDGSSWGTPIDIATGIVSPSVKLIADLDGDGDLDVLATASTSSSVSNYLGTWWFENASGNGAVWSNHVIDTSLGSGRFEARDVDLDGDLDFGRLDASTMRWFVNDGSGNFTSVTIDGNVGSDGAFDIADIDNDGIEEWIQLDDGNTKQLIVYEVAHDRFDASAGAIAPATSEEQDVVAVLEIDLENEGIASDVDIVLSEIQLAFANAAGGAALTTSQLSALLDKVAIHRDDGDGSFSAANDSELVGTTSPSLSGGVLTLNPSTTDPDAHFVAQTPGTLFVVLTIAAAADTSSVDAFTVTHLWGGTELVHDGTTTPAEFANPTDTVATVDPVDGDIDNDGYFPTDCSLSPNGQCDCDDGDNAIYPTAPEVCDDAVDSDCDNSTTDIAVIGGITPFDDFDNDGSPNCQDTNDDGDPSLDAQDCDDYDATIYPGAPEVCDDAIDSDCDNSTTDIAVIGGVTDFDDFDNDGSPNCQDTNDDNDPVNDSADCNDYDATVYPGAPEVCDDAIDSDCDNSITDLDDFPDLDGDLIPDCTDTDDDGDDMSDAYEIANHLDPLDHTDALADPDADGRSNIHEHDNGTDPQVYDGPDAPVNEAPNDGADVAVTEPELEVTNATSPTSEVLTYTFEVYTDAALTEEVVTIAGVTAGSSRTAWTVDVFLQEAQTYYWRVAASDPYIQGPWSTATSFTIALPGAAPSIPEAFHPLTGEILDVGLETVTWLDSTADPADLEITYTARLLQSDGSTELARGDVPHTDVEETERWDIDFVLTPETFYCWQVRATDEGGRASDFSNVQCFGYDTDNVAPTQTVFVDPLDGDSLETLSPLFRVTESVDAEEGPVEHEFRLDTSEAFDSPDVYIDSVVGDGSGEIRFDPGFELVEHTTYWARIQASDRAGGVSTPDIISVFVRGENDAPDTPALVSPEHNFVVGSNPVLTAGEVDDLEGDAVRYEFVVAVDKALTNRTTAGVSDEPSFTVVDSLSGGQWWSVRAVDELGAASSWAEPRWLVAEDASWGTCTSSVAASGRASAPLLLGLLLLGLRRRVQRS